MKIFLVLTIFFVSVYALDKALKDEQMEKFLEIGLECAETEKATTEDIEALKKYDPPVTHEGKCTIFCVNKKFNWMGEDGSIVSSLPETEWLKKVEKNDKPLYDKLHKIHNTCKEKVEIKTDGCETAADYAHCFTEGGKAEKIDELFQL